MAIKSGEFDLGLAVGFDKHPRGAFNALPSEYNLPDWYGETGLMLTTQFFAAKISAICTCTGSRERRWGELRKRRFATAPVRRTPGADSRCRSRQSSTRR